MFNDKATFGDYVYLMGGSMSARPISHDVDYNISPPRGSGSRKCQNRSFRFHNFILIWLLVRISDRESMAAEFAQTALPSRLFAFRVPSGPQQLRMVYSGDELANFSPQAEKARMGFRTVDCERFLTSKLSWRMNLTSRCIIRRSCCCGPAASRAHLLGPAHSIWPDVKRRVAPGELIFSTVNRRNSNRILKAVFPKLGIPDADRYSSHGFRMWNHS